MNLIENIRMAIYSIRTNFMRSALTMLGIIIGVCSVIAIVTVGNGGRDYIVDMIKEMGSSNVGINLKTGATDQDRITEEDVRKIKSIDGAKFVSPISFNFGTAETDYGTVLSMVLAGNEDFQHVMNTVTTKGRFFTQDEYQSAQHVCVLSNIGATQVFGTNDVVGEYVNLTIEGQSVYLKVVGVATIEMTTQENMSSMMDSSQMAQSEASMLIMIPSTLLNEMMGVNGYDMLYMMAKDESQLDTLGNAARNILYSRHGNFNRDVYEVSNVATYIDLLDAVINILTTFIAGVSAISLIVGGIGVMNIMLVSVTERTREIGIRKALGAKTGTIMFQFLTESVILCVFGGLIGFILGVGGAVIVAAYMGIPITIKLSTIAIAIGFSSAIGIFFGIYPARKAAKMLPIEALRRD
ncbi:MAG: ABC transporter permease [Clostridia bacterium]|nr:ABC transporter permease [Clostridia bacterium]